MEQHSVSAVVFAFSWALKILACSLLLQSIKKGRISKFRCYLIHASQKIHMMVLFYTAPEVLLYGAESLFWP